MDSPWSLWKDPVLLTPWFSLGDPFWTFDPRTVKMINVCDFKLQSRWEFLKASTGN